MDTTNLLLAQALSISGLIGATAAYAGIIRRRQDARTEAQAAAIANAAAIERVDRHMTLGRIEHTFIKSAYRRHNWR